MTAHQPKNDPVLEDILRKYSDSLGSYLDRKSEFRIQVIYTKIDRNKRNRPSFTNYYFNVNRNLYFYPASTIKMPVALLSLEKIHGIKADSLDKFTTMITGVDQPWQTGVLVDPTASDCKPSLAQYIRKIFLVSDDDASNRLYEFLGQEYLNNALKKKGYDDAQILHRLSIPLTSDQNRYTNPVSFHTDSGALVYQQPAIRSTFIPKTFDIKMGHGYVSKGKLVNEPFDFSLKNRLPLEDLHQVLRSVLFPTSVPRKQRFRISSEDRSFVMKYMSQYPAETAYPPYDRADYWDGFGKFIFWGAAKEPLPSSIRIFNKVGDAYGFLIDAAYIVDFEKKIEFMVSATIYCNKDGIFNDDQYDYESVGWPFLRELGQALYRYELQRNRERSPDLSVFRFNYNEERTVESAKN